MTAAQEQIIQAALEIVRIAGSNYQPEDYAYWVTESCGNEYEDDGSCEEYCEKCIKKAVTRKRKEYRAERQIHMERLDFARIHGYYLSTIAVFKKATGDFIRNKTVKTVVLPEDLLQLEQHYRQTYPKRKHFKYDYQNTYGCGVLFNYGLLLDDQELDHWNEQVEELQDAIENSQQAYELSEIFESVRYVDTEKNSELIDKAMLLAKRVIKCRMSNPQEYEALLGKIMEEVPEAYLELIA